MRREKITKIDYDDDHGFSFTGVERALVEMYQLGFEEAEKIRLKANASCGRGMQFGPED